MVNLDNAPRPASRGIDRGLAARVSEVLLEYRGRALRYDVIAQRANCREDQVGATISYLIGIGAKISRPMLKTVVFHKFAEEDGRIIRKDATRPALTQIQKLAQYLRDHQDESVTLTDLMDVVLTSRQSTLVLISRLRTEFGWTINRDSKGVYTSTPPGTTPEMTPEPEPQEQDTPPEVEVEAVDIPLAVLPVAVQDPIPALPANGVSSFTVGETVIFDVVGRLGHFDDTHLVRDSDGNMFRISPLT